MKNSKREERLAELDELATLWDCPRVDALLEILHDFYEAAGFPREGLAAEFGTKTEEELLELYLNL